MRFSVFVCDELGHCRPASCAAEGSSDHACGLRLFLLIYRGSVDTVSSPRCLSSSPRQIDPCSLDTDSAPKPNYHPNFQPNDSSDAPMLQRVLTPDDWAGDFIFYPASVCFDKQACGSLSAFCCYNDPGERFIGERETKHWPLLFIYPCIGSGSIAPPCRGGLSLQGKDHWLELSGAPRILRCPAAATALQAACQAAGGEWGLGWALDEAMALRAEEDATSFRVIQAGVSMRLLDKLMACHGGVCRHAHGTHGDGYLSWMDCNT